jgi:hypothetical protein
MLSAYFRCCLVVKETEEYCLIYFDFFSPKMVHVKYYSLYTFTFLMEEKNNNKKNFGEIVKQRYTHTHPPLFRYIISILLVFSLL